MTTKFFSVIFKSGEHRIVKARKKATIIKRFKKSGRFKDLAMTRKEIMTSSGPKDIFVRLIVEIPDCNLRELLPNGRYTTKCEFGVCNLIECGCCHNNFRKISKRVSFETRKLVQKEMGELAMACSGE
ncbi:MAG: hypothetical protein PHP03_00010 [Candidatus Pacebacteria bacterium]|nr:hypothetical protein [Candidatus Paceibacterota bacterium]